MTTTVLACPRCNGTGEVKSFYRGDRICDVCDGTETVTIDEAAIRAALTNSRTGKIRASKPSAHVYGAAYVWRMARFDGGVDVSLPVMAADSLGCMGVVTAAQRAVEDALAPLVRAVAEENFGSSLRGAVRWGRALGMIS